VEKIKIDPNKGPVVFIGGMNAMPMMYAMELKKLGVKVIYVVDRPASDTLSRPENHYQKINYPYPNWVIEAVIPSQILVALFPRFFLWWINLKIRNLYLQKPQIWILNGFFVSLAPYLVDVGRRIFLSHGSDLDTWADTASSDSLGESFVNRSIFKFLPDKLSKILIKKIVKDQFIAVAKCCKVVYFPKGFNSTGDRILNELINLGVDYIPRYDVSFDPLESEHRGVRERGRVMNIFSGVRFLFATFPDGNFGYNKGNDIIIKGLSKYYKRNKNIAIHFVEKGEDVELAKKMCIDAGIEKVVLWHKEMKFTDLLKLYRDSDVCFDQVGAHWIGSIGFYALWLGKPLIANDLLPQSVGLWDATSPILSASTADDVERHLISLESFSCAKEISSRSMIFAENVLGPKGVMDNLFEVTG